jgi:hypothetical protein
MVNGEPTRIVEFTDGALAIIPDGVSDHAAVVRNNMMFNIRTGEVIGYTASLSDNPLVERSESSSTTDSDGPPPLVDDVSGTDEEMPTLIERTEVRVHTAVNDPYLAIARSMRNHHPVDAQVAAEASAARQQILAQLRAAYDQGLAQTFARIQDASGRVATSARQSALVHTEPEAEIAAEETVPICRMSAIQAVQEDVVPVETAVVAPVVQLYWTGQPAVSGSSTQLANTVQQSPPPQGRGGNFFRAQYFEMPFVYMGGEGISRVHLYPYEGFPASCTGTEAYLQRVEVCKECVRTFKVRLMQQEYGRYFAPAFFRTSSRTSKVHFYNDMYCTAAANRNPDNSRIITRLFDCSQCAVSFTNQLNAQFQDIGAIEPSESEE